MPEASNTAQRGAVEELATEVGLSAWVALRDDPVPQELYFKGCATHGPAAHFLTLL